MRVLHYNDEEKDLHRYLADRGHLNTILSADQDPFATIQREPFDAAFIGLHPLGFQLIRQLLRRNTDCLVTMITADRNTRMAVEAMKLGAFDYLLTPLDFTDVERTVIMMMREHEGQRERAGLEGRLAHNLRGESAMRERKAGSALNELGPPRGLRQIIAHAEIDAIRYALSYYKGNIAESARALGISRTTLYSKMVEYGIPRTKKRSRS